MPEAHRCGRAGFIQPGERDCGMYLQVVVDDVEAAADVRERHCHLPVEPPRPQERLQGARKLSHQSHSLVHKENNLRDTPPRDGFCEACTSRHPQ